MAKKKYEFISEKVYRSRCEVEVDLDEIRANNESFKDWEDEDILVNLSDDYLGVFNTKHDWLLEECNVRSIYGDNGETIYEG